MRNRELNAVLQGTLLLLFMCSCAFTVELNWEETTTVISGKDLLLTFNNTSVAVRDDDDILHLVFLKNDDIMYGRLMPGSSVWEFCTFEHFNDDDLARRTKASIAYFNDGDLIAIWVEGRGDRMQVVVSMSTDHGTSWDPPQAISDAGQNAANPSLWTTESATATKRAAIAWTDDSKGDIWVGICTWFDSGPGTWMDPFRLAETTPPDSARDVSVSGLQKEICACWEVGRAGDTSTDLYYSITTDGGQKWLPNQELEIPHESGRGSTGGGDPCVAYSQLDQRLMIAYQSGHRIYRTESIDGSTFDPRVELGPGMFAHLSHHKDVTAIAWEHFEGSPWDDCIKRPALAVTFDKFANTDLPFVMPGSESLWGARQTAVKVSDNHIDLFWLECGKCSNCNNLLHRSAEIVR
jgi:hypothetical protein